ncbi:hypothetical protein BJ875DRAFT_217840 [Amylocarpus encephaloides]|uniref:Uncharacterized protein n=1 Tax=Amylocarpus encephaloides TaxID=45428 RepID=A0A9P8C8Y5_9HELO|nr:hypothetical protein BJ875DRAFT_217840 [Amylocarpus encephaloides]
MQPTRPTAENLKVDMSLEKVNKGEINKGEKGNEKLAKYEQAPSRNLFPNVDIIKPALQSGGLAGLSGLIVGGFTGVIRSSQSPFVSATATGIQWTAFGTTFHASRSYVFHMWGKDEASPQDKIKASAIAGSTGGSVAGLLRGTRSIIPGAMMFSLFGAAGQYVYNRTDARSSEPSEEENIHTWLNSKWSPVKVLSHNEYEDMLLEKLLSVNARIALLDENIESLRAEERMIAEASQEKEELSLPVAPVGKEITEPQNYPKTKSRWW